MLRYLNALHLPIGLLAAVTLGFIIWTFGPRIETAFFPVTSEIYDVEFATLPNGRTAIQYKFDKFRGECEFVAWVAFAGQRSGLNIPLLPRRLNDTDEIVRFPTGEARGRPWSFAASEDTLRTDTRMKFVHRCHPFWLSTTWIWGESTSGL